MVREVGEDVKWRDNWLALLVAVFEVIGMKLLVGFRMGKVNGLER